MVPPKWLDTTEMIITKTVMAYVASKCKPHYEGKGYKLPYQKDKRGRLGIPKGTRMEVSVYDLPPSSNEQIRYKCDDCGIEKTVAAYTIFNRKNSQYNKTGETLCSNCANKRMSGKNNSQFKHGNTRYCEYRWNANHRGIDFNLSADEFEDLTNQPCHYCGGYSKDRDPKSRGNGIDRKDSTRGYHYANCVPCCATCNFIKNTMQYDEFLGYIKSVYENIIMPKGC